MSDAVVIEVTPEVKAWLRTLGERDRASVQVTINLLRELGLALNMPHCSALKGTHYAFFELRVSGGRSPIRMVYAFDPRRKAIILLGGSKANDKKFYERAIAECEVLWERHLEELKRKEAPEAGAAKGKK